MIPTRGSATSVRSRIGHRGGSALATGEPLHGPDEHVLKALCQGRAPIELSRVAILRASLAEVHLQNVGGELRLPMSNAAIQTFASVVGMSLTTVEP